MRYSIAISAVLAVVTLGLPPAFSQVLLRAGHISPKESVEGMAIDRFADLVKQKTNGTVTVQVFPSEQLGKAPTEIESVIIGNQDIYFGGTPEFERFSDGLKLLGVNWAIPSEEAFRKITKDPIWKEILLDPLDKQGLTVLASNWERGLSRDGQHETDQHHCRYEGIEIANCADRHVAPLLGGRGNGKCGAGVYRCLSGLAARHGRGGNRANQPGRPHEVH